MIGKMDPRLNLTSSPVKKNEESIHDLACLVILVTLTLFITGFLCIVCKIYDDDGHEVDQPDDPTAALCRKKSKVSKSAKASTQPSFLKAPNNTPIQSPS